MADVTMHEIKINIKPQVKDILAKIGEECANDTKASSPKGYTGKYASGWTSELEGDETVVIYNGGEHSSLSHLIELGHRTKSGGSVAPQEHIRPAYNRTKKKYMEDLKKIELK